MKLNIAAISALALLIATPALAVDNFSGKDAAGSTIAVKAKDLSGVYLPNVLLTDGSGNLYSPSNAFPIQLSIGGAVNSATNGIFINPATGATFPVSGTVALGAGSAAIGSITNTSFGISGTLPAFATTPTFNIGTIGSIATTANQASMIAALGAPADAAWGGSGAGSLVALEKYNAAALASMATAANNPIPAQSFNGILIGAIEGDTAKGAAVTENPLFDGARAATTEPTAVTDGQKIGLMGTPSGKLVTMPYAPPALQWRGSMNATGTTGVNVSNSSNSTLKTYVTGIQCGRTDAGTAAITVTLNDTGSTPIVLPNNSGGGGNNVTFPTPLVLSAVNTSLQITSDTAITTLKCSAQGYFAS